MPSLILKNGHIADGTGRPLFQGNIVTDGDRIVEVTRYPASAEEVVDVSGLVVAPGFIDMHSHSDLTLLKDPNAESKVRQGVTSEVIGNCGISMAPVHENTRTKLIDYVSSLLSAEDISIDWRSFEEYLSLMERSRVAVNVVPLVGHGTVRIAVMGFDDRRPSQEELEEMKSLVRESLSEGAFGMSSGLIYPPGCYAKTEELVELCKVVSAQKGIYCTHIRGEGETLLEAVEEAIEIGRQAVVPVEISHHKAAGKPFWGYVETTLRMINEAVMSGLDVTCDQYPYTAGWTKLSATLPDWVQVGGVSNLYRETKG